MKLEFSVKSSIFGEWRVGNETGIYNNEVYTLNG